MELFDGPYEALHHGDLMDGPTPEGWVPDIAERRETLRRANQALERARELLERVRRIEGARTHYDPPGGESISEAEA